MTTDAAEIARQLAARRKIEQHTCPVDGTQFEGTKRAAYCSSKCKLKAQRKRKAERGRPLPPAPGVRDA